MHCTPTPSFLVYPADYSSTGNIPTAAWAPPAFAYASYSTNNVMPPTTLSANSPEKCAYRTGKCFNVRANKRNGMPHKLCAFHREKANLNQMKLDQKKRLRRGSCGDDDSTSSTSSAEPPRKQPCVTRPSLSDPQAIPTRLDDAPPVLAVDELDFFCDAMSPRQTRLLQLQRAAAAQSHSISLEVVV
ncbi:hypothetical protein DYB32_002078 [Aphanomyces invadans]|uniref:Uncharacterized protein n=1 Tax=Aphanomyces invadans TaxID=157072 RepID=A0A3R6YDK0_9STRA|nr:hypothetical protein DYB32_002078 [Aphanomyces invadans]